MASIEKSETVYSKYSLIVLGLAVILLLVGAGVQFKKTERSLKNDFKVYYKTSERIEMHDWDEIFTRSDGAFPYRYAPYSLMSISWLNYFPELQARKIWLLIQVAGFFAGFYFLYRSLLLLQSPDALWAVSVSSLLTARFFMDSLCSGQVAGLIFLAFSIGLYDYLSGKFLVNVLSTSFSASLKIIPGLLLVHGFIKAPTMNQKIKFFMTCVLLLIGLNAVFFVWLGYQDSHISVSATFVMLWQKWMAIVLADGEYFDGSTAKNQALRGFLLRLFGKGNLVEEAWKILACLGFFGLVILWFVKKSQTLFQDAYAYCLGILGFILFMPESLPYQIMNVAIPLAVFLACPKRRVDKIYKIVTILFLVCISLPGSDFIGRPAAEWVQAMSFPFMVMALLTFVMVRDIWRERV